MNLKVVSWNIFVSKNIPQVIEQLKVLSPDIIGLQEVVEKDGVNAGKIIADTLGYNHIFCEAHFAKNRQPPYSIGNSILSRIEVKDSSCGLLSTYENYENNSATEPRSILFATFENNGKEFTIATTHLGYSPELKVTAMQKMQLDNLLMKIHSNNFVLMGDFNSLPESEIVKELEKKLLNTDADTAIPTPTRVNIVNGKTEKARIDYIFITSDIKYSNFTIHETTASDHTPLSVEITV